MNACREHYYLLFCFLQLPLTFPLHKPSHVTRIVLPSPPLFVILINKSELILRMYVKWCEAIWFAVWCKSDCVQKPRITDNPSKSAWEIFGRVIEKRRFWSPFSLYRLLFHVFLWEPWSKISFTYLFNFRTFKRNRFSKSIQSQKLRTAIKTSTITNMFFILVIYNFVLGKFAPLIIV